jgi:hypothetical protein
MSAMIHREITMKFVVPTVLVLTLGISIGAAYLPDKHFVPVITPSPAAAELLSFQTPTGDFRVHLLFSRMK